MSQNDINQNEYSSFITDNTVGQIERGQLSFLLVTIECVKKNLIIFGTYKLHKASSGKMPISS